MNVVVLMLALVAIGRAGTTGGQNPCAETGYSENDRMYYKLVCAAEGAMQRERFAEAAQLFEKASTITLFEFPNFMILPRVSEAFWRAGDKAKAVAYFHRAEMTLMVEVGAARCVERDDGWHLVPSGETLDPVYRDEVRDRMCSAVFEDLYLFRTFEDVRSQARRVDELEVLRRLIFGPAR